MELQQQLGQAIAGTSLSVVTIDNHHESVADARLHQTSSEITEQIVKGFDPQPAAPNLLRIVEYAQGWPLMAVLVLRAIRNDSVLVGDLTNDQLTQRLIGYSEDSDAYAVLALLGLFDHVGYRERVASEGEQLRAAFLPRLSYDEFHRIVKGFERKGLIAASGRYWRVTPPLAIRLTRRWLEDATSETRERLFTSLPRDLTESLERRFGDVTTETPIALAAELLRPSGLFCSLSGILGSTNMKIVQALAEVNPEAAIKTLARTLAALSDEEFTGIDEESGQQTLVWTLEAIAFHAAHFKAAAQLLFALARNENALNSNNATGAFSKFFAVQGSQTEAHPKERIAIIDRMLEHDDLVRYQLVAKALSHVLYNNSIRTT